MTTVFERTIPTPHHVADAYADTEGKLHKTLEEAQKANRELAFRRAWQTIFSKEEYRHDCGRLGVAASAAEDFIREYPELVKILQEENT